MDAPFSFAGLQIDEEAIKRLPPGERAIVERRLEEARREFEANPLLRFRPHPKQQVFLERQGFGAKKLFIGGNRSGKTTNGVADDLIQLVDRESVPPWLQRYKFWEPPVRLRVVTVDFKQSHEVMLDKFREWSPRMQLKGNSWKRAYDTQARRLWFKNGSWAEFMSQEQDVDAFSAQTLHRVHFDEEPAYDIGKRQWNECMARLIDLDGDALLTMTPLFGMSWVHDDLYLPAQEGRSPDTLVVEVAMDDNPYLSKTGMQRFLEGLGTMSSAELASRRDGSFVAFEGLIYPEWKRQTHVVPVLEKLPPAGPFRRHTVVAIDPGAAHPRVLFMFADDAGRVTIFDELAFPQGARIDTVCSQILEGLKAWGVESPSWFVIDPAARNREQGTARPVAAEYATHGVPTRPGINTRTVGIGRIKALLEADGFFRVTENCLELIREFPKYRWKGSKRSENSPREEPVKRDDHSLDCARYGAMSLPAPRLAGAHEEQGEKVTSRAVFTVEGPMDQGGVPEFGPGQFA